MAGQISIRLPDALISRLNRTAKRSKRKRAEIIRSAIEVGLTSMESDAPTGVEGQLDAIHKDLIERLSALPQLFVQSSHMTGDLMEVDSTEIAISNIETKDAIRNAPADKIDPETKIELLPADNVEDEGATSVEEPFLDTEKSTTEKRAESRETPSLFQDADGTLQNNQRTVSDVIDVEVIHDQRISSRLKRARVYKGWSTADLGGALNMDVELVEDIESGRCEVPKSRGIRVEAKLQQWEAEMST